MTPNGEEAALSVFPYSLTNKKTTKKKPHKTSNWKCNFSYSGGYFQVFKYEFLTHLSRFTPPPNYIAVFASEDVNVILTERRKPVLIFIAQFRNQMKIYDRRHIIISVQELGW